MVLLPAHCLLIPRADMGIVWPGLLVDWNRCLYAFPISLFNSAGMIDSLRFLWVLGAENEKESTRRKN